MVTRGGLNLLNAKRPFHLGGGVIGALAPDPSLQRYCCTGSYFRTAPTASVTSASTSSRETSLLSCESLVSWKRSARALVPERSHRSGSPLRELTQDGPQEDHCDVHRGTESSDRRVKRLMSRSALPILGMKTRRFCVDSGRGPRQGWMECQHPKGASTSRREPLRA
jgi:hypothetical protein